MLLLSQEMLLREFASCGTIAFTCLKFALATLELDCSKCFLNDSSNKTQMKVRYWHFKFCEESESDLRSGMSSIRTSKTLNVCKLQLTDNVGIPWTVWIISNHHEYHYCFTAFWPNIPLAKCISQPLLLILNSELAPCDIWFFTKIKITIKKWIFQTIGAI